MDEQTEHAISAGLQRGDPQAWAQLYDAHAERLFREVSRWMGGQPTCQRALDSGPPMGAS
jgi:hypothetical protein